MNTTDQIRHDQTNDAQRRVLSVKSPSLTPRPPFGASKKPFVAKGHDAILKNLQDSNSRSSITLSGDSTEVFGQIVARDKFTITLEVEGGARRTFYKHAIESFGAAARGI